MTVFNIPDRTIQNPLLNMRETNHLLSFFRNLVKSKRYKASSSGVEIFDEIPSLGTINVAFTETVNPYSIFFIKHVNRSSNFAIPLLNSNVTTRYDNTKQAQAEIIVTNGPFKITSGTIFDCNIIGFETPHWVKYTSTTPDVGDRLRVSTSGGTVIKHNAGELVCVGKPITDHTIVPVVRHYKIREIYGKTAASVTYGNPVTINIWRNNVVTSPLETETGVLFNWLGKTGQVIPSGTMVEAKWWDDLNNGAGAYRISNSNCEAS